MTRTLLAAVALLCLGCPDTDADYESPLSNELYGAMTGAISMAASLGAEIAVDVAAPPGPGGCPASSMDGDDLTLDFGNGCQASSGLLGAPVGGLVELLMPTTEDLFLGDVDGLGFQDLPAMGSISGVIVRTGDVVSSDLRWEDLTWTQGGVDFILSALFSIEVDATHTTVNVPAGTILRGNGDPFSFSWDGVVLANGLLDACSRPSAGDQYLEWMGVSGETTFDADTDASGTIGITFTDREAQSLVICP
jgi:hypothetical protein